MVRQNRISAVMRYHLRLNSIVKISQFQQNGHIILRGVAPNVITYRDAIVEAKKVFVREFSNLK